MVVGGFDVSEPGASRSERGGASQKSPSTTGLRVPDPDAVGYAAESELDRETESVVQERGRRGQWCTLQAMLLARPRSIVRRPARDPGSRLAKEDVKILPTRDRAGPQRGTMKQRLVFQGVNGDKQFASGDTMLRVDFLDSRNVPVADWCPRWAEVEQIVSAAILVEQANREKLVTMLRGVESRLQALMPQLPIRRQDSLILEYDPSKREVTCEYLTGDRRGWRPVHGHQLATPIAQSALDKIVAKELGVGLVLRGDAVVDIYYRDHSVLDPHCPLVFE